MVEGYSINFHKRTIHILVDGNKSVDDAKVIKEASKLELKKKYPEIKDILIEIDSHS